MSVFLVDSELERVRHKVFCSLIEDLNATIVDKTLDQQTKVCNQSESSFWFHFENNRRRRLQIVLRTRKYYPVGEVDICVHQVQPEKSNCFS